MNPYRVLGRRLAALVLLSLALAPPATAEQPKCPFDVATCLEQYHLMSQRPWLGVMVDRDSTGRWVIEGFSPGSPAQRAGLRRGDVMLTIERQKPEDWFAGKAGWNAAGKTEVAVRRASQEKRLAVLRRTIPDELFSTIIGVHMLEGHLAHMHGQASGQAR